MPGIKPGATRYFQGRIANDWTEPARAIRSGAHRLTMTGIPAGGVADCSGDVDLEGLRLVDLVGIEPTTS